MKDNKYAEKKKQEVKDIIDKMENMNTSN